MELGTVITNVLAGASFAGVLLLCLFLMLPVASIAASARSDGKGGGLWGLAFYGLIAVILYWLFNGFSFMQNVFTGNVFDAGYWTGAAPSAATAGTGPSLLMSAVVWVIYLAGVALLGLIAFYGLASIEARFSANWLLPAKRASKINAVILFVSAGALTYLWQDRGRQWLLSLFL